MAVLMAIVGGVGLAATLSASVVERTREFGVLRTIGGSPATVVRMVITEGLFVGAVSWFGALVGALPLSAAVGTHVGALAFRSPLPLVLSPQAPFVWLAVVVGVSALASAIPAWRASRLTVREALAYT
jgi:putative ABC transport system permease protein